MSNAIYPCIWFNNQAKAAAEFYLTVFKSPKITIDTPMVVNMELNGLKIMGLNGGPRFKVNPAISFSVLCESIVETNEVWDKLIQQGKVLMPIQKYNWSERYGWLQDKFDVTWQISVSKNSSQQKIIPSFLFTGQQFGRAESALQVYRSIFSEASIKLLFHYDKNSSYEGKVLYSEFELNQSQFIAMDGPGMHDYTFNEGVSLVVECETQQEIDHYWNHLTADGGEESMCGWLKDKFGVSWQIIPKSLGKLMSDSQRASSVMHALLKMKKIELEVLRNV
jgi:predicted 3-demethylubiquinone-9 3-methyltransferase (glyoxalase superfamily)